MPRWWTHRMHAGNGDGFGNRLFYDSVRGAVCVVAQLRDGDVQDVQYEFRRLFLRGNCLSGVVLKAKIYTVNKWESSARKRFSLLFSKRGALFPTLREEKAFFRFISLRNVLELSRVHLFRINSKVSFTFAIFPTLNRFLRRKKTPK